MRILASLLFVLLIFLQLKLWFGGYGLFQLWSFNKSIESQQEKNAQLTKRNNQLSAEVRELKQAKDALEERARSQLGMIKEGEIFYRVVPEEKTEKQE